MVNILSHIEGVTHDCGVLNEKHGVYIAALAKKEVVSICDTETMANSWSFEGEKAMLRTVGNYLIVAAVVKQS